MNLDDGVNLSPVEQKAVGASPLGVKYAPDERIPVITVDNFPALGRLAAMRFIEWVQHHPGGVISLPTGKTPEHFIKWVERLLGTWDTAHTRSLLEQAGIDPAIKPEMESLHFVQIDEFYPIEPTQKNSFYHYVREYYIKGFGLDPAKALLMNCREIGLEAGQTLQSVWPDQIVDLSLRTRQPTSDLESLQQQVLHRIDDWCQRREDELQRLGGIGFFLGGIGPDGHIGFNIRGSDHHSTTRLMATNYETQAAAAGDLGGIEISRTRLVITIGLGTIAFHRDCTALIVAAGEAKAKVVADAVQGTTSVLSPASALRRLPNARFYITLGAAKHLRRRQVRLMENAETADDEQAERALVDLALARRKRLGELDSEDAAGDPMTQVVLARRSEPLEALTKMVHQRLEQKISSGSQGCDKTRFLHTEPHHDDLMLGYLPLIVRNVRNPSNSHYFATLTSGFTAVTNQYMLKRLRDVQQYIGTAECTELHEQRYFAPDNVQGRNRDIWQYLDGIAAKNEEVQTEGAARRMLRNLIEICDETDLGSIANRMTEMQHYFETVHPGKKDTETYQQLKGMCREWEAECLWGYFGWQSSHIMHLRLGFYTGDLFTQEPTVERDVAPVLDLLRKTRPDIISVAFDPEASGPDTHYKVLQAANEAVQRYAKETDRSDLRIWGYRNVWYRFHPSEANVFVPVSMNMFSVMENAFLNTFVSQREASFPSYEHDGPFSELAQRIQVEQFQMLKTCLGREWFAEHSSPLIRGARGFVFLRDMDLDEFSSTARRLRRAAENQ
jgi:glucosamine-6-phosphate deaminase